jgi:hypothetical protein
MSTFHVGFWGNGEVTVENATELLDSQLLPTDPATEFAVYLPEEISRAQQGLRAVQAALKTFALSYEQVDATAMLAALVDAEGPSCLVVLGTADEETALLTEAAIGHSVTVYDLSDALKEVEYTEPAPDPPPQPRGRPRGLIEGSGRAGKPAELASSRATEPEAVEAKVEGLATMVAPRDQTAAELLDRAIRAIIHEEISHMGLTIGTNTHLNLPLAAEPEETVRVFTDADGGYELAPSGAQRAPRGKKSEDIALSRARELGLLE